MDAPVGMSCPQSILRTPILLGRVWNLAAWVLSVCLALAAVFLMSRRCVGALTAPLPALLLIGVGIAATAVAVAVHGLPLADDRVRLAPLSATAPELLAILALPLFAAAVTLSDSDWPGVTLLWITVGGAELGLLRWRRTRPFGHARLSYGGANSAAGQLSFGSAELLDDISSFPPPPDAADATQKLVYHRSAAGKLSVDGWLLTNFVAGQRTALVHVAFCPAFQHVPSVEAELQAGPLCEIHPTLVLPWGVRWEVKLDTPATAPCSVRLEFIARDAS